MKRLLFSIFTYTTIALSETDDSTKAITWQWEGLHAIKFAATATSQTGTTDSTTSGHSQIDLYAQVPIIQKKENYFGAGIVYRLTIPQLENLADSLQLESMTEHTAQLALAWWHKINDNVSIYSEFNGGISGLSNSPSESQSHLLFSYFGFKPKPNRFYRAGLAVAYQFGKPAFYPLLGGNFGFTDHFAIDAMFPTHLAVRFKINNKLEFATKSAYSVGGVGIETTSKLPVSYNWSHFSGSVYGDYRIHKGLIFRIEGGSQFLRKIEILSIDGDSIQRIEPQPTPFVTTSIRWQV